MGGGEGGKGKGQGGGEREKVSEGVIWPLGQYVQEASVARALSIFLRQRAGPSIMSEYHRTSQNEALPEPTHACIVSKDSQRDQREGS